ncbi:MAG: protein translocase subunit SecF [Myxococcales bacterium]|nr:protein translocase subunit SecF [Myxococcales bacterium]
MSETHKPFREIIKPNSNFEFIEKRRTWGFISFVLVIGCIAMLFVNKSTRGDYLNWTIDFKGGTELIFAFEDKEGSPLPVGAGTIRGALNDAGKSGFAVSNFAWMTKGPDGKPVEASGMMVRTPEFGAVKKQEGLKIAADFVTTFASPGVLKATWSGDRMFVRASGPIDWTAAQEFFKKHNKNLREWTPEHVEAFSVPAEGTEEYSLQFSVAGLDAQYQDLLSKTLGAGAVVKIQNVYGVGARAGEKLRNDGIKSLFYVMALIMLYLAFRFDVRYAPGAVVALVHDAILVIGVFAITWQEVSLTTVAALLTVIGYSVNDSVVIFDRIRENVVRLKDKKFGRVINISLNETMARTLLTSITLFVVTLMMNLLGTGLVRNFAFAMNIGVVVGVYSSIFVASPVALAIHLKWFSGPVVAKK